MNEIQTHRHLPWEATACCHSRCPFDPFATSPTPWPPIPRPGTTNDAIIANLAAIEQLQAVLADEAEYCVPDLPYTLPADFVLSVVIPVFNERATIARLLARVYALPLPLQIIVVDDCSTDGTSEVLECASRACRSSASSCLPP